MSRGDKLMSVMMFRVSRKRCRDSACLMSCLVLSTQGIAHAAIYDALCGESDCQIDVSGRGIGGPEGFIPANLVSQWSVGQNSGYHGGKGVAGGLGGATAGAVAGGLLLGPIGLLGGLLGGGIAGSGAGKEFEGFFTVTGYDKQGNKIAHSFYFINKKPATRLRSSLPSVTGLALGEQRSVEELEVAFAKMSAAAAQSGSASGANAIGINPQETGSVKVALPTRLGESQVALDLARDGCWEDVLVQDPALTAWASANPILAEKKMIGDGYKICGDRN